MYIYICLSISIYLSIYIDRHIDVHLEGRWEEGSKGRVYNIPLHAHTTTSFLSSVGGHLGCIHVLAIVNCAAVNTDVHGINLQ